MYKEKAIQTIEAFFCCPVCKQSLVFSPSELCCSSGHAYKIINDIIVFEEISSKNDVALSKKSWEKNFSRFLDDPSQLLEEEKNPYVKSYDYYTAKFFDSSQKDKLCLDVGCGIALNSLLLANKGIMTINTDISLNALNVSRNLFANQGLEAIFVCANTLNLPFKKESFDFVFSGMSLEYFEDTDGAVNQLSDLIKSSGSIFAILPIISLATLYYQLSGNIWDLPIIKQLSRWIHLQVFKGRLLKHGYDKTFSTGAVKKIFQKYFSHVEINFFTVDYELKFLKYTWLIKLVRKLLKYRPFWPLVFIYAKKTP